MLKGKATKSGGDFALCPSGSHPGILIGAVDLGTHWESFQGQKERKTRRLFYIWELECEIDGKDSRVFIGRDFNIGINDKGEIVYGPKSGLRQLLEGWRGKQFSEGEEIDPEAPLGRPCLVQVAHERTKSGKDVSKIKSVSNLLKGMQPLKPTHPKFSYSADGNKAPAPDDAWLPRVYGETIVHVLERCLEWGGDGRRSSGSNASPGNGQGQTTNEPEPEEEEIPF